MSLKSISKLLFDTAVRSVLPGNLVRACLSREGHDLIVKGTRVPLENNVYVVGFGKAVLGMGIAADAILHDSITRGILSIPVGLREAMSHSVYGEEYGSLSPESKIQVMEGAKNNLPDDDSVKAADCIEELLQEVKEEDILIALISGGGSALLASPVSCIALKEKRLLLSNLAGQGASITELNSVRRKLSRLKGGKLAHKAKCNRVISLIISDIVGNPMDLIASGPTVEDTSSCGEVISILEKYDLYLTLPERVRMYLEDERAGERAFKPLIKEGKVTNVLIGSNNDALMRCKMNAETLGFRTVVLTNALVGEAREIGKLMIEFIFRSILSTPLSEEYAKLFYDMDTMKEAEELLRSRQGKVCLLASGETTVQVKGFGKGGRNQELALSASLCIAKLNAAVPKAKRLSDTWFAMLSAGTDGQDGPTAAAGAFAVPNLEQDPQMDAPSSFLENNDSFSFYSRYCNGDYHVMTGLTGTNVMDLQVILFDFDNIGS